MNACDAQCTNASVNALMPNALMLLVNALMPNALMLLETALVKKNTPCQGVVFGNISAKEKNGSGMGEGLIVNTTARNLIMIHTCIYESCIVVTVSAELQK